MANEFVESAGTEIFLLPPGATEPMVMSCPTAASKSGGERTPIEILCLNALDPEIRSGSRTATTWNIPFALVPTDTSHQELYALEASGELVPFVIALSDGVADPTVAAGALIPPINRSSFAFEAIVANVGIEIATNDVVRGTLDLRASGATTKTWKS